jgi:hypothetical protein
MKFKAKTKVTIALLLFVCALFVFLFYTPLGLLVQTGAALQIQRVYLRFLSARVTTMSEFYGKDLVATQLHDMGINDLWAARDAVSAAIAQRPGDQLMLRHRADIEIMTLSYSNAVADYEQALKLSKQSPNFDFPLSISNHLEMARVCAAAKERYWYYWKNHPSNPPTASEYKPASPSDN